MKLEIRTPTAADVPGLSRMWCRAYGDDVLNINLYPRSSGSRATQTKTQKGPIIVSLCCENVPVTDVYSSDGYVEQRSPVALLWRENLLTEMFLTHDPRRMCRMMVDVDSRDGDGRERVVGYCGWIKPRAEGGEKAGIEDGIKMEFESQEDIEGLNRELLSRFTAISREEKLRNVGTDGDYWELSLLCVDPAYGHKGIGRRLLRTGLEPAKRQGKAVYSTATRAGLRLYLSEGFERVGQELLFDNLEFGGEYTVFPILKKPESRSTVVRV